MFSPLDSVIFPDDCEVIEFASQFFVYPIFKNGSSSLNEYADQINCRRIQNQHISNIDSEIHIYLRDARSRFVSGVNTFVQHNGDLDLHTQLTFINRYLFLNRHFAPQFFWVLNLARYLPHHVPMILHHVDELHLVTPLHSDAKVRPPSTEFLQEFDKHFWNSMELYYYLDQKLTDKIGDSICFTEFIQWIKQDDPALYNNVFGTGIKLVEMIHGLS